MNEPRKLGALSVALLLAACGGSGGGGTGGSGGVGGSGGMGGGTADAAASDAAGDPTMSQYYPVAVGTSWTYRVTAPGAVTYKVVTIEAAEKVGGVGPNAELPAYRHRTCKSASTPDGCSLPFSATTNRTDQTVGWWGVVAGQGGTVAVNYREQSFKPGAPTAVVEDDWWDPYRLRIDEQPVHMSAGAKFNETFKEVKKPAGGGPTISTNQTVGWSVDAVADTVVVMLPGGGSKTYTDCVKISHTSGSAKSFWYAKGIGKVKEDGAQTEELLEYRPAP
jgi:hypothetical protein